MNVREMTLGDTHEVALLASQLGYPSTPSDIEKRLGSMSRGAEFGAFVVEKEDGRVAGWIHVHVVRLVEEDAFAEIGGLVVDANCRGQGLGKALLSASERWAKERGYSTMCVRSNMKRIEARPFYESRHYKIVKSQFVFHREI